MSGVQEGNLVAAYRHGLSRLYGTEEQSEVLSDTLRSSWKRGFQLVTGTYRSRGENRHSEIECIEWQETDRAMSRSVTLMGEERTSAKRAKSIAIDPKRTSPRPESHSVVDEKPSKARYSLPHDRRVFPHDFAERG